MMPISSLMAQDMMKDDAPDSVPDTTKPVIETSRHIGHCVAIWMTNGRIAAEAGLTLITIPEPKISNFGKITLMQSTLDLAKADKAMEYAEKLIPPAAAVDGMPNVSVEEVRAAITNVAAQEIFKINAAMTGFGSDLKNDRASLDGLQAEDAACMAFMNTFVPGGFRVVQPEVDLSKLK
ncbi:unnamed protein product [Sphagnum tenellum]